MIGLVAFGVGLILGAAVAWAIAYERGRATARTEGDAAQGQLRAQIEALLPRVAESVLADKATHLQQLATGELKLLSNEAVGRVTQSQAVLEQQLKAMQEQLASYQARITAFETDRAGAQERVQQQLNQMAAAGAAMTQESRTLREALATSSGVRGRWGEAVLKNILDACGLNEGVDFEQQVEMSEGGNRLRPDAVVRLPTGRCLVIDVKASLTAFVEGLEAPDSEARRSRFAEFARVLRRRADELSSRDYSRTLPDSLPYVVMFVPSEGAFRAALDADPELFRYGQDRTPAVMLASPSTLFPLIAVVAQGWQQHRASEKMIELLAEVKEFGNRLRIYHEHVGKIGRGLDAAGKAYGEALASFNRRLAPRLERLETLGADWAEVEELKPLEHRPQLAATADNDAG